MSHFLLPHHEQKHFLLITNCFVGDNIDTSSVTLHPTIRISTHTDVHLHTHTHAHAREHAHAHAHAHTRAHTHTHTHTHTHHTVEGRGPGVDSKRVSEMAMQWGTSPCDLVLVRTKGCDS